MTNGFFQIIIEIFAFVFGNYSDSVLEFLILTGTINGTTLEPGTIGILNPITADSLNITSILQIANNICDIIILPIADCLLIMYFLFTLVEMASNETFTLQQFGKALGKVVLFHILILNTFSLMVTILDLGNALVRDGYNVSISSTSNQSGSTILDSMFLDDTEITDNAADAYLDLKSQYNTYKDMKISKKFFDIGFYNYLGNCITHGVLLAPAFLISVIAYGAMFLAAITRIIQIAIRLPLAPLGLADLYNGGVNSRGMGTLKGLLALAFQGIVIIIIIAIGNILSASMYSPGENLFKASIMISIVKLAQISLLGKSLDVSKEMLGA